MGQSANSAQSVGRLVVGIVALPLATAFAIRDAVLSGKALLVNVVVGPNQPLQVRHDLLSFLP